MNRSFLVLLVVAVALVLLVLLLANPFQDSIRDDNPEPEDLFESSGVAAADQIGIRAPSLERVTLARGSEGWVVANKGNFPADTTAVGSILEAIQRARSTGIVSTNPQNRGKFQVDTTGVEILVSAESKPVAHFFVGKVGQDFTTSYVRRADGDDVYVVRGINHQLFSRPQGLRDRTLMSFPIDSVSEVVAEMPEGGWGLARTDTAWVLSAGGDLPVSALESEVDRLMKALSTLAADGFLDAGADTVATGLESPDYTFTVRFMNGSEARVEVGKKSDTNQYYVARPDRRAVFLLAEWRLNNLAKTPEDLITPDGGP